MKILGIILNHQVRQIVNMALTKIKQKFYLRSLRKQVEVVEVKKSYVNVEEKTN